MDRVMQLLEVNVDAPTAGPGTWAQLLADCIRCVAPQREHLHQAGVTDPKALELSDKACAAAMLANLWRDVRVDVIENGLIYLPGDVAARHGLDLPLMRKAVSLDTDRGCDGRTHTGSCDCASMPQAGLRAVIKPFCAAMRELVGQTHGLNRTGRDILSKASPGLRCSYRQMTLQTDAVLRSIAGQGYDTLTVRPQLGGATRAILAGRLRLASWFDR